MLFFRINTTLSVLEGPACLGDGRVLKRTVHIMVPILETTTPRYNNLTCKTIPWSLNFLHAKLMTL